jgi:hypothetical protein
MQVELFRYRVDIGIVELSENTGGAVVFEGNNAFFGTLVESQKAVAEAQKAVILPLRLTGWGTIGLAAATFILALLTACDGPLAAACSRLSQLIAG